MFDAGQVYSHRLPGSKVAGTARRVSSCMRAQGCGHTTGRPAGAHLLEHAAAEALGGGRREHGVRGACVHLARALRVQHARRVGDRAWRARAANVRRLRSGRQKRARSRTGAAPGASEPPWTSGRTCAAARWQAYPHACARHAQARRALHAPPARASAQPGSAAAAHRRCQSCRRRAQPPCRARRRSRS